MIIKSFNVISDTHGLAKDKLEKLISLFNQADLLVFLGDGLSDIAKIEDKVTCPIIKVKGNCDLISGAQREVVIETQCGKILFVHGHDHRVKSSLLDLCYYAMEKGCSYVYYGHTHVASVDVYSGVTMVNPGSLGSPRLAKSSFCSVIEDRGQFSSKIVFV